MRSRPRAPRTSEAAFDAARPSPRRQGHWKQKGHISTLKFSRQKKEVLFALLGGHPSPVLVDAVLPVEDGLEADLRGDRLHVQNDVLEMENRDRDEALCG